MYIFLTFLSHIPCFFLFIICGWLGVCVYVWLYYGESICACRYIRVHMLANGGQPCVSSLGCWLLLFLLLGCAWCESGPSTDLELAKWPTRLTGQEVTAFSLPAVSRLRGRKCTPPCPAFFSVGSGNGIQILVLQGKPFYWVTSPSLPHTPLISLSWWVSLQLEEVLLFLTL